MTGFIIFTVVLTIAYIIYYLTMISIDLTAQHKGAETEEEIIVTGKHTDEIDEFATQHVVEDISTGGFSFMKPKIEEDVIPIIEEAQDDTIGESQLLETTTTSPSSKSEKIEQDKQLYDTDAEKTKNNTIENTSLTDEEDECEEENGKQNQDCAFEGITTVTFTDEEEKTEKETFKEEDAFNPELRQKTYGVTTVYEASSSPEVQTHADTVNSSMEAIAKRCMSMDSSKLRDSLRRREQSNISYRDVYSKF